MKTSKDTPAFVRYFNSRFQPLTKPLFLGSLGSLLIVGLAIYQYWRHPEWLQTNSESVQTTTSVSQQNEKVNATSEDLATAADLDNINFLLQEINQNAEANVAANQNNQTPKLKREESEFSRFQKEQRAKLNNAGESSSSNFYSLDVGTGNQKILELLQPPSFSSYQSNRTNQYQTLTQSPTSSNNIIPNPVGNIYLSERNQNLSTATTSQIAPSSGVTNSGISNNVNSNGGAISNQTGQNSVSNSQPVNTNNINPNQFVPASSLIQSQATTVPAPIVSSTVNSSTTRFNSLNNNSNTNNNLNPGGVYSANNTNSANNLSNNINNNNAVNGINSPQNLTGTTPQTTSNYGFSPSLTTNPNSISRENFSSSENNNDNPSVLQNNYRSYRSLSPSYNRSTPSGYQLQPQSYLQNGFSQNTVSGVSRNSNSTNLEGQTNNAPITRPTGTPILKPSGVLSTSEVGR